MGKVKVLYFSIVMLLLFTISIACNADGGIIEKTPHPPYIPPPPYIPTPYADANSMDILDMAFETDSELAISESRLGIHLFDVFGELEGNISDGSTGWGGLTTARIPPYTSRGIIATGPVDVACGWKLFFDSPEFTEEPLISTPEGWWFEGIAHPPGECNEYATSGIFECTDDSPRGIAIHPIYGWLFVKMGNPKITFDGTDCDLPYSAIPVDEDMKPGIIAMHPLAPEMGPSPDYYEGAFDWVAYHDYSDVQMVQSYGYPMCGNSVQGIIWDETNPPTFLPDREGITTSNVTDFVFDAYGRMICVLPVANAWAITEPVVPPDMIVIQRIIGGDPTGMSDTLGDFNNPSGCAVNPQSGDIYITDTGHDRVQVFDPNGNFIRMFGHDLPSGSNPEFSAPTAIEIDGMGNVYVATAEGLQIFNEYGLPLSYGCLDGYVKDKNTLKPLDHVLLFTNGTFSRHYVAVSDENGYYNFQVLPEGTHILYANRPGYRPEGVNLFVTGGQKTTRIIYLERGGLGGFGDVTGTIISSLTGDPLSNLLVTIKYLGISDTTNFEGRFRLYNVPPGYHILQISSAGIVVYEEEIHVLSDAVLPLADIFLPI